MKRIKERVQQIENIVNEMNSNDTKKELQQQLEMLRQEIKKFEMVNDKTLSPLTQRILINNK